MAYLCCIQDFGAPRVCRAVPTHLEALHTDTEGEEEQAQGKHR